jgi:hypothetical protein
MIVYTIFSSSLKIANINTMPRRPRAISSNDGDTEHKFMPQETAIFPFS